MSKIVRAVGMMTIAAGLVAGCNKADSPVDADTPGTPHVAVVDIDKVANDLGWMKDANENIGKLKAQFAAELKGAQDSYKAQFLAQKKQFAPNDSDKLTPQQQQILGTMDQVSGQLMLRLQQEANQKIDQYLRQWVIEYRNAMSPTIRQVSEEKHMWVALDRNTVLFSMATTDITDAVVDAARSHPPVLHQVPFPTLSNPGTITINATTQPTATQAATPATAPASPDNH